MTDWNNRPLTLAEDLAPQEGEAQLTFDQTLDLLLQLVREDPDAKYGRRGTTNPGDPEKRLVIKLAMTLPDEMRYASVLTNMDRRQLYAQVMAPETDQPVQYRGMEFDPEIRELAAKWFVNNSEDQRSAAEALAQMQGIEDPVARQRFVDEMLSLQRTGPGVLRESPSSALGRETQQPGALAEAALGNDDSPDSFTQMFRELLGAPTAGTEGTPAFMTDADVQALFRLSGSDMGATNAYLDALSRFRAEVDPNFQDPFEVDFTAQQADPAQQRAALQDVYAGNQSRQVINQLRGGESYTISESVNMLYGMKPAEIRVLQQKLKRAGYFVTAEGGRDEPLFWGDATDARTQAAWRNLIGDAVRTGTPVYEALDRRIKSAQASGLFDEEGNALTERPDVRLTDRSRIRQEAETQAKNRLGRNLTPDEHNQLVEFIHGLETKEANTLGAEGSQTVEATDVGAQIAEYLERENSEEAGGRDVALTYNDFTRLLAGPGRGGSF